MYAYASPTFAGSYGGYHSWERDVITWGSDDFDLYVGCRNDIYAYLFSTLSGYFFSTFTLSSYLLLL